MTYESEIQRSVEELERIYRQSPRRDAKDDKPPRKLDWRAIVVCFGIALALPVSCAVWVAIAYAWLAVYKLMDE